MLQKKKERVATGRERGEHAQSPAVKTKKESKGKKKIEEKKKKKKKKPKKKKKNQKKKKKGGIFCKKFLPT